MSLRRDLNILCEAALNEGGGAGVNLDFEVTKSMLDGYTADLTEDGDFYVLEVGQTELESYEDSAVVENGGVIKINKQETLNKLKEIIKQNKFTVLDEPYEVKDEDIDVIGVEGNPNLTYSRGWIRAGLTESIPIDCLYVSFRLVTYEGLEPIIFDYDASPDKSVIFDVRDNNGTANSNGVLVPVDATYYPSEELKNAYDRLDEYDDYDESLNEDLPTSQEYKFKIEKLNDKGDFRLTSGDEYVSDIYVPEGDTLKDNIRDYIDCEFMYDLDDSENICSTELSDYKYDEENGEGSFTATIFWEEDLNESVDEHTEVKCRMYARMLEKINEKFGTLIGTFKIEPLYTNKYELGLKRGYGKYDFKFVSDDAFIPLKNKSLEEQAEYLKGLILGKE